MKKSLGTIVKLLSCDLVVMNSSYENNLLLCKVRLHTIDLMWFNPSPRTCIGKSFMDQATL